VPLTTTTEETSGRRKVKLPVVNGPVLEKPSPALAMDGVKITGINAGGCGN